MPNKVPLWIIKNTFCPYGNRMPGRPETLSPDLKICATCQRELYRFQDWNYCDTLYYCNDCIKDAREEARKSWAVNYGRGSNIVGFVPRVEPEIPSGNLPENDYAFWIGNLGTYSTGAKSLRATCRACGSEVFGEQNRQVHKLDSLKLYLGNVSCTKVLALCYQQLLKLDRCMVCSLKCFGKQKWGVSLCSPSCTRLWKFDETIAYPELERAVMQFWAVSETKSSGSGTSESTSSQTQTSTLEEPPA